MIQIKQIEEAEKECKRFLERCKAAKERLKNETLTLSGSKETGALKRSALDLKMTLTSITQNPRF